MNNDELMKELEELTRSMEHDFLKENQNTTTNKQPESNNTNQFNNNPFANFSMPYVGEGNEDAYMKELQKLLNVDLDVDENDPECKEMMKLLSIN